MTVSVIRALLKDMAVAYVFAAVLHHQVMSDTVSIIHGYAAVFWLHALQGAKKLGSLEKLHRKRSKSNQ